MLSMKWDRIVTQKAAETYLLQSVLMHRRAGGGLWALIKLAARMWYYPDEETARLEGMNGDRADLTNSEK